VEYTIDNAFNLRDLVLKELVKIIVVWHTKNSKVIFLYKKDLKSVKKEIK